MRLFKLNRIALVCNSLNAYAGVETRTFELACFLRDQGHEVEIVALRSLGKVSDLYREEAIPVHHIPVYRYTDRIVLSGWNLSRLALFFLRRRYGVIVGVQPPSHYFSRLAAFPPLGRRLFAMERLSLETRSARFRRMDRLVQRWTDKIICVADLMKEQLVSKCGISPNKIVVVNNGISISASPVLNKDFTRWAEGAFVFGFVGLLEERKRPGLLLEAFARLARSSSAAIRLAFVGDGEQRAELMASAQSRGIADRVFFAGDQKDPHPYYARFDAFVFPSILEGFGTVWGEAMLHGLPVICADTRPMNDYVKHEVTGLLAVPDDVDSLMDQMIRLQSDAELRSRIGKAGRTFALANFNREIQLKKLEAIFWPDSSP